MYMESCFVALSKNGVSAIQIVAVVAIQTISEERTDWLDRATSVGGFDSTAAAILPNHLI